MSSVLDRSALADSPLADLHLLANELGVDGFRRLRKDDLIDAIVAKQAGEDYVGAAAGAAAPSATRTRATPPPRRPSAPRAAAAAGVARRRTLTAPKPPRTSR